MSDRLTRFAAEADRDPVAATERPRAELVESGGPLVQRISDDAVRVTFGWIGPDEQVSVRAQVFEDRNALSHPMRRVPGTDVWRLFPQMAAVAGDRTADPEHWDSVLRLPDADEVDWFDAEPAEPGALTEHRLDSRTITACTPPGYRPAETYPLVDGECRPLVADLPTALDNLVGRAIAPSVVAMVHNAGGVAPRMAELACDPGFAALLADRVVPFVRSPHAVADRAVVAGTRLRHAPPQRRPRPAPRLRGLPCPSPRARTSSTRSPTTRGSCCSSR